MDATTKPGPAATDPAGTDQVPAGLTIQRVPLGDLHEDPANARSHGPENLAAIMASLRRFGQAEPLVVQAGTRRVIGGNGRLVGMRELGWTEADVVELDINDVQATALGIALNRTADLADWDEPSLARLLESLRDVDALDGVGFSDAEIEELLAGLGDEPEVEQDEVPEPQAESTARRGDLWILGPHRLLCGDSSSPADVDRLLAGAPVHMLNTDPPYNVRVEPRSRNAIAAGHSSFAAGGKTGATGPMRAKDRPLENDYVSDEEFGRLLRAWFGNAARVLQPGRAFYVWGGYANVANYPAALAESGLYFSQTVIWVKEHPVLTRKDFMGNHEWCFYGWREGAAHQYYGPDNATDVWSVKKVNPQAMVHLTEKPVELAARAIRYSSRPGENVLDLFGGSGSTLAACQALGRHAFLVEIDGPYADVIIDRWQRLAGEDAVLEADGRTFAEVAAARTEEGNGP